MRLVKTRSCDGACCRAAPAFPKTLGDRECCYRDPSEPEKGCRVMRGEMTLAGEDLAKFERICRDWPHNMPDRATGDCCWQWVE